MSSASRDTSRARRGDLRGLRVALVGPAAPPVGGMTVQAALLEQRLRADGVEVARVASNPPVGPVGRVPKLGGLCRLMRFRTLLRDALSAQPDVLHVQSCSWTYFWRITSFALREGRSANVRTVLRWDGGEADAFFAQRTDDIREVMQRADRIVVPSGYLAEVFERRLGLSPDVISNLVDAPPVRTRGRSPAGALRVLSSRHLQQEYGIDVVLAAVARAVRDGADLRLTVVGDGPDSARLTKLGRRLLGERVRFTGRVPRERVLDLLDSTDVVVNGSRVDNFPIALAEALAVGVPVATSDAGGIPWVVADGESGLVTAVDDAEALAASLGTLDADRELLRRLGRGGRAAAARWTWDALRPQWTRVYLDER